MEEAQSAAFTKAGAFFAFGQKQFDEKMKPGIKYASLGAGLICPSEKADELMKDLDAAWENGVAQDVAENGAEAIIEREYFNHECQLTSDTEDARNAIEAHRSAFPELFTEELIVKVFRNCFTKAVDNDWF